MNQTSFLPSVLLVDDDSGFTDYLKQNFHEEASLGVLIANTLSQARKILNNKKIQIDAIVSDLFFEEGYTDRKHKLLDGIDLLNYGQKKRPEIDRYVCSIWSERDSERKKAEELNVDIKLWMNKMFYDPKKRDWTPWGQVLQDQVLKRSKTDVKLKDQIEKECDLESKELNGVTKCVEKLKLPMRTFIQDLNDNKFVVKTPIPVLCYKDADSNIYSTTLNIGLNAEGHGDTVDDALDDLAETIKDQYELLHEEPEKNLIGFAKMTKERLDSHIDYT